MCSQSNAKPIVNWRNKMPDPAYHTKSPEYGPKNREVYHNNNNCSEEEKIKKDDREPGTDGRPLCKEC